MQWLDQVIVELYPYDAGTDSGQSYSSPNEPTAQPEDIYKIEVEPLRIGEDVPALGTFTLARTALGTTMTSAPLCKSSSRSSLARKSRGLVSTTQLVTRHPRLP